MGIPGAGKSRIAEDLVGRGYVRLNRDERGGSLRELADALEERLASGVRRVVLDNTYLTRASRSHVSTPGAATGSARCVWLDTPLAQAQVNLVERVLDRAGVAPGPRRAARPRPPRGRCAHADVADARAPRARAAVATTRDCGARSGRRSRGRRGPAGVAGVFVAAAALEGPAGGTRSTPLHRTCCSTGGRAAIPARSPPRSPRSRREVSGAVEGALCPHPGGPPSCWCRPPLPGLPLAFARAHGVEPARSVLVGVSAAHRTLATTLGARYVDLRVTSV